VTWYVSHASQFGRAELRFRADEADRDYVAESPTFKGDQNHGPNDRYPEHRAACDRLIADLVAIGWRPTIETPKPWYAQVLSR
jgi:hypothetical protein